MVGNLFCNINGNQILYHLIYTYFVLELVSFNEFTIINHNSFYFASFQGFPQQAQGLEQMKNIMGIGKEMERRMGMGVGMGMGKKTKLRTNAL